jgi:curved DNA-binding protein CbpA
MSDKKDYYQVLGITKCSTTQEVRHAFKKLALVWHPDKHGDKVEANKKFHEIYEAYNILSNSEKRTVYNTFGHDGLKGYEGTSTEDNQKTCSDNFYESFGKSAFDVLQNIFDDKNEEDDFFKGCTKNLNSQDEMQSGFKSFMNNFMADSDDEEEDIFAKLQKKMKEQMPKPPKMANATDSGFNVKYTCHQFEQTFSQFTAFNQNQTNYSKTTSQSVNINYYYQKSQEESYVNFQKQKQQQESFSFMNQQFTNAPKQAPCSNKQKEPVKPSTGAQDEKPQPKSCPSFTQQTKSPFSAKFNPAFNRNQSNIFAETSASLNNFSKMFESRLNDINDSLRNIQDAQSKLPSFNFQQTHNPFGSTFSAPQAQAPMPPMYTSNTSSNMSQLNDLLNAMKNTNNIPNVNNVNNNINFDQMKNSFVSPTKDANPMKIHPNDRQSQKMTDEPTFNKCTNPVFFVTRKIKKQDKPEIKVQKQKSCAS